MQYLNGKPWHQEGCDQECCNGTLRKPMDEAGGVGITTRRHAGTWDERRAARECAEAAGEPDYPLQALEEVDEAAEEARARLLEIWDELSKALQEIAQVIAEAFEPDGSPKKPPTTGPPIRRSKNPKHH